MSTVTLPAIDTDLVAAIAWCRIGGAKLGRPADTGAFRRAEELGLLAHDPIWRATHRGEGVLVALGLLDGAPAGEQAIVHVLWARCDRYPQPRFVRGWADGYVDLRPDAYAAEVQAASDAWRELDDDDVAWTFWSTVEHLETRDPREADDA